MRLDPTAKVTIITSKGEITIELYAKELPKSCRAFLQNCVSKRYNGLRFDIVGASFIQSQKVGADSKIPVESHSRLKFEGRGCVGLLSHDKLRFSSADGFFIALKPPSELHTNHVYIGKVVGDSIYNVLKIADVEKKHGTEEPMYPVDIVDTVVSTPYFQDLLPANSAHEANSQKKKKQKKSLKLDFGDDDSENSENTDGFQMKSAHETLNRRKPASASETQEQPMKVIQGMHDSLDERYKAYLDLSDDSLDAEELENHIYNPI